MSILYQLSESSKAFLNEPKLQEYYGLKHGKARNLGDDFLSALCVSLIEWSIQNNNPSMLDQLDTKILGRENFQDMKQFLAFQVVIQKLTLPKPKVQDFFDSLTKQFSQKASLYFGAKVFISMFFLKRFKVVLGDLNDELLYKEIRQIAEYFQLKLEIYVDSQSQHIFDCQKAIGQLTFVRSTGKWFCMQIATTNEIVQEFAIEQNTLSQQQKVEETQPVLESIPVINQQQVISQQSILQPQEITQQEPVIKHGVSDQQTILKQQPVISQKLDLQQEANIEQQVFVSQESDKYQQSPIIEQQVNVIHYSELQQQPIIKQESISQQSNTQQKPFIEQQPGIQQQQEQEKLDQLQMKMDKLLDDQSQKYSEESNQQEQKFKTLETLKTQIQTDLEDKQKALDETKLDIEKIIFQNTEDKQAHKQLLEQIEEFKNQKLCNICFEGEKSYMADPCGHLFCAKCKTDVEIKTKCFFCLQDVIKLSKMFQ